jgi:hypothetical protein
VLAQLPVAHTKHPRSTWRRARQCMVRNCRFDIDSVLCDRLRVRLTLNQARRRVARTLIFGMTLIKLPNTIIGSHAASGSRTW